MNGRSLFIYNYAQISGLFTQIVERFVSNQTYPSERRVKSLILRFLHAYMHANQRFIGFHLSTTQKVEKNNDYNITPD